MNEKIKLPQKGGAKKAAKIFEESKKQQPTDRLIKIISEIPEVTQEHTLLILQYIASRVRLSL